MAHTLLTFEPLFLMKKTLILLFAIALMGSLAAQDLALDGASQLYGYKNSNGAWCIAPQYQYAYPFQGKQRPFAVVKYERYWGCVDTRGQFVVRNVFNTHEEAETAGREWQGNGEPGKWVYPLFNAHNRKWGFVNYYGQWKFEAEYEAAGEFEGTEPMCFAPVKLDGRWGCIDAKGILFVNNIFLEKDDAILAGRQWIHGSHYDTWRYPTKDTRSGLWGYVNYLGRWIVEAQYTDRTFFGNDHTYLYAQVRHENGRWGNIDRNGNRVSHCIFASQKEAAYALSQLEHGRGITEWRVPVRDIDDTTLWGWADYAGELAIAPIYQEVTRFANDTGEFATGRIDGYWCVVGAEGIQLSLPVFVRTNEAWKAGHEWDTQQELGHWLFPVQDPDTKHWGYVNYRGQWAIMPYFEDAKTFISTWNNRVAPAKMDGLWGCIDHTGQFVVKNQYNTSSEAFVAGRQWSDTQKF